jgi:sterol desaturase/sphingolipid hydroxylase (fatty acid hydroxylase superfamily)
MASTPDAPNKLATTASPIPRWLSACVVAGTFLTLTFLERRRPLRQTVEPGLQRPGRNLAMAAIGSIAIHFAETPLVTRAAAMVERRRWGLVKWLRLPLWLEVCAAVVLMDYTLYLWHVLTHRVPVLWRFHAVHHIDLDLDASTAVRFHFGELVLSAPWRVAQIIVIGTSPLALSVWQTGLLASILFHHSNLALPVDIERRLSRVIVTPRMHGIHHSVRPSETESNWSSGLSVWDRLHRTLRLNVSQRSVVAGVVGFQSVDRVDLMKMLILPFDMEVRLGEAGSGSPERPDARMPLMFLMP